MGLYEREYARSVPKKIHITNDKLNFIKQTYQLFAASLISAILGLFLVMPYAIEVSKYFIGFVLAEFLMLFIISYTKNKPGINLLSLFAFAFLSGVTLVPVITYLLSTSGLPIIANALVMTIFIVAIMSLYAIKTKKDLTNYPKMLMIALFVIIVFSLLNLLLLHSGILSLFISGVVVLIFSYLIIVDTQNIIQGNFSSPVEGAISLYLDFLNIFTSLLQILGFVSED